jgi:hypothetical protein
MSRWLLGPMAITLLLAACSSSHPAAKPPAPAAAPGPVVNAPALRAYAETIESVYARVDTVNDELRGCLTSSAPCTRDAAASATVAVYLLRHLMLDDGFRESGSTNTVLAPGISPLLVATEHDARVVKRTVHALAAHPAELSTLRAQIKKLAADVDAWRPGGSAALAVASVHVSVPPVAPNGG